MTNAPETDLEAALRALETAGKTPPGRWEARAILVPLGLLLQARGREALSDALQRLEEALNDHRDSWRKAVEEELSLACAEHIQGVDPRYLSLPNFDWDYLMEARERLEARKVAAEALQIPLPAHLWAQVLSTDERLAPHLEALRNPPGKTGGDLKA